MKLFYLPKLPIHAVKPYMVVHLSDLYDDPKKARENIDIRRKLWEQEYKVDIRQSLKLHGQLNPCLVTWYPKLSQWLVEPGQARWFAMDDLGFETFKVLLKVDTHLINPFSEHEHRQLHTMDEVVDLYTSGKKVKNRIDMNWFRANKWLLTSGTLQQSS